METQSPRTSLVTMLPDYCVLINKNLSNSNEILHIFQFFEDLGRCRRCRKGYCCPSRKGHTGKVSAKSPCRHQIRANGGHAAKTKTADVRRL
jgi:hypothetical protein